MMMTAEFTCESQLQDVEQVCSRSQNTGLIKMAFWLLGELNGIKTYNHLKIVICSLPLRKEFKVHNYYLSTPLCVSIIFKYGNKILFRHKQLLHQREAALCSLGLSLLCLKVPILCVSREDFQKACNTDMLLSSII